MRKRWLGAAFLGAWLSATAGAQPPQTANAPGRATVTGASPMVAPWPGQRPLAAQNMPEPVPLQATPAMPGGVMGGLPPGMHPGMPAGMAMGAPPAAPPGPPPGMAMGAPPTMPPAMPPGAPPPHAANGPVMMGVNGKAGHGDSRACYFALGAIGLQRERLGGGTLALLDAANVDTGVAPAINRPVAARFNDMEMDWMVGYRAVLGYHWNKAALELSGYYIPQDSSTHTFNMPRRLSSFFINPPVGFEGNNFLWLQADQIRTELRTTLGNGEVNLRCWCGPVETFSWIIGARYVDLWERLRIFTDDDGLTVVDAVGRPDPTRQATYTTRVHNRIVAGQFGFEWNIPLNCFVAATWTAKGAWGANFVDVDVRLQRGDGFRGPGGGRSETIFSSLYDTGFFLDWKLHRCAKLRTGWNALWLVHVAEAVEQVDFNLANTSGRPKNDGDIFYHGPTIELHVVF